MEIKYFKTQEAFRRWLDKNHDKATEIILGMYRKSTGIPSVSYFEALDVALCYGWIDGIRRKIDEARFSSRFTPRKKNSIWSKVNIGKVEALKKAGLMHPAGLRVYENRNPDRAGLYSFENKPSELPPVYLEKLKANKKAWTFFSEQAPWYRRTAIFLVMSAKQESTRLRRLDQLIADSAEGKRIKALTDYSKKK